jgi:glutaconyl-CoA/methylmalonyl-CoA decarboxylase subunit delta
MQVMILLQETSPQIHESAKKIAEIDPVGLGMTMLAMAVVFLSLLVLFLVFKNIARIYTLDLRKKFHRKKGEDVPLPAAADPTGELGAAVALALFYYQNEMHDHENTLLTIKKVSRTYSPWSSKIYGLRRSPK